MLDLILQALAAIMAIAVPIITKKYSGYLDAKKAAASADTAKEKLIILGLTIAGKAWDRLAPQVQAALADGKLTAEERAAIETEIKALALEQVSEDELAKLGAALGLPFAGVIAKVASYVIEKFALAHDKSIPSVSSLAYPVQEVEVPVEVTPITFDMLPADERPPG